MATIRADREGVREAGLVPEAGSVLSPSRTTSVTPERLGSGRDLRVPISGWWVQPPRSGSGLCTQQGVCSSPHPAPPYSCSVLLPKKKKKKPNSSVLFVITSLGKIPFAFHAFQGTAV